MSDIIVPDSIKPFHAWKFLVQRKDGSITSPYRGFQNLKMNEWARSKHIDPGTYPFNLGYEHEDGKLCESCGFYSLKSKDADVMFSNFWSILKNVEWYKFLLARLLLAHVLVAGEVHEHEHGYRSSLIKVVWTTSLKEFDNDSSVPADE